MPGERQARRPRMLGIDIDGTMIRSDGRMTSRVKSALRAAVDAGLHVVPATGRPKIISGDVIDASQLDGYWVFANGAITRHLGRDELIRGFWMSDRTTRTLLELVRGQLPGAGFAIEFEETVAWEPRFAEVVPIVPDVDPVPDVLTTIGEEGQGPSPHGRIQKILVFDPNTDLDVLFDQVSASARGRATASYSGLAFIELAASDVTKATALRLLAEDLGVDTADVACFGDNHNDRSMLMWAGRGYAMANATDDAKAAADEVIGLNDEDGLAVKIEELLALPA